MIKWLSLLIVLTFSSVSYGWSQVWRKTPIEVFGGFSGLHYFGDIGGTADATNLMGLKDIKISSMRPGLIIGARYRISKPFQVKAYYSTGFLAQTDLGSRNERRNFGFFTYTNEVSVLAEYYFLPESDENYFYSIMQVRGGLRHFKRPWSAYVALGAGALNYYVSARDNLIGSNRFVGNKHFTMVIPVGIGVKYAVYPRISIGAELGAKYSLTDYIDGLTSIYSQHNDLFYTFVIKANFKINYQVKRNIGVPRKKKFLFF